MRHQRLLDSGSSSAGSVAPTVLASLRDPFAIAADLDAYAGDWRAVCRSWPSVVPSDRA